MMNEAENSNAPPRRRRGRDHDDGRAPSSAAAAQSVEMNVSDAVDTKPGKDDGDDSAAAGKDPILRQRTERAVAGTETETESFDRPVTGRTTRPAAPPSSYEAVLNSALSNASRWSHGVVAIEVWSLDSATQRLHRVPGGYWRCPYYPPSDAVSRLEDEDHPRYMPPVPLQPGVGFVGSLWAEGDYCKEYVEWRNLNAMIMDPDQPRIPRTECLAEAFGMAAGMTFRVGHGPLEHRGVVVYYTRPTVDMDAASTDTNLRFLRSATDLIGSASAFRVPREEAAMERRDRVDASLRYAANRFRAMALFSSCLSVSTAPDTPGDKDSSRKNDGGGGKRRRSKKISHSRLSFTSLASFGSSGRRPQDDSFRENGSDAQSPISDGSPTCFAACCYCCSSMRSTCQRQARSTVSALDRKRSAWLTKIRGGDILPPPGLPGRESLFAMLGILLCLALMSGVNEMMARLGYHEHSMILSAFGGLVVNLFCLPASPNSQPRNCLFGLTINVFVGMAFRRIPTTVLPLWARGAISPAVSISAMAYLGYIHPPAGGAAVAFALGKEDEWLELGLLLFGWTISVAFAAVYNNLSEKRAYPNYWRFLWLPDAVHKRVHKWRKRRRERERKRKEMDEAIQLSRHVRDHILVKELMAEQQQEKQGPAEQV